MHVVDAVRDEGNEDEENEDDEEDDDVALHFDWVGGVSEGVGVVRLKWGAMRCWRKSCGVGLDVPK